MTNYPRKRNLRDGGFLMVGKHGEERSPKVFAHISGYREAEIGQEMELGYKERYISFS